MAGHAKADATATLKAVDQNNKHDDEGAVIPKGDADKKEFVASHGITTAGKSRALMAARIYNSCTGISGWRCR
jgi:hypothetical protein